MKGKIDDICEAIHEYIKISLNSVGNIWIKKGLGSMHS